MKLFENKVGRPSNEIIMKRRSFSLVVTALVVALIGSVAVAFSDIKSENLSGSLFGKKTTTTKKIVAKPAEVPIAYNVGVYQKIKLMVFHLR